jgi:hypothetical protein
MSLALSVYLGMGGAQGEQQKDGSGFLRPKGVRNRLQMALTERFA